MRVNTAQNRATRTTAEGGRAATISAQQEFRRLAATCMLWEDGFYIDGVTVADRISQLVGKVSPEFAAAVAFEARTKQKLRHLPLLIVREMARLPRHKALVGKLLPDVIQRADEMTEFLAIYWKDDPSQSVSKQVKIGLTRAFRKFSAYDLAKYNRNGPVKLRDVLRIIHAKPGTKDQSETWAQLMNGTLAAPDTWEVALSSGAGKRETFERLMVERKLGALAFLRNLRNMVQAGVSNDAIRLYASTLDVSRVLPFRFLAAARAVPKLEPMLEVLMLRALAGRPKLAGQTAVLVDVSGSMSYPVSSRSDITRLDAAAGVAIMLREICDDPRVFRFDTSVSEVPPRHGFALRDAIGPPHGGTRLWAAVEHVDRVCGRFDRMVVFTDEQTADFQQQRVRTPKAYMINVASNLNGVGYGKWHHIDGWSESVIDYLIEFETPVTEA